MPTNKVFIGNVKGPKGDQGVEGPQGIQGVQGVPGKDGAGVPDGGSTGQVLAKASSDNQVTKWIDVYTKTEVDGKINPLKSYVDKVQSTQEITLGTIWASNKQTISANGVTADSNLMLTPKYSGSVEEMQKQKDEWGKILKAEPSQNSIIFTSSEDTTLSLTIVIKEV